MKYVRIGFRHVRHMLWAITVAFMIALHNVYHQRMDSRETIEWHQEHHSQVDNSDTLHDQWHEAAQLSNNT